MNCSGADVKRLFCDSPPPALEHFRLALASCDAGAERQHADKGDYILKQELQKRAPLLAFLISDCLADCSFGCADSFCSIECNSCSERTTFSLKRPLPAGRIYRLDHSVFDALMFHAPS